MRISDWSSDVCSSDLQGDFIILDHVDDVRTSFGYLVDRLHFNAGSTDRCGRTFGRHHREADLDQIPGNLHRARLVTGLDAEENQIGRASGRARMCKYV